jgi:exodeoxyribonuclease VII small subunit
MKAKMTFEERLQRLQEIVAGLESGALPLEESVNLYKEGLSLSRQCKEQLEKARNEVRLLSEGEFKPFDAEDPECRPEFREE